MNHLKKAIMLWLTAVTLPAYCQISSITGEWKTVDDNTGEVRALVRIYKAPDGLYYGKIEKLYMYVDAVCDKCEGAEKGKPVLGMTILHGMKAANDLLKEGYVLDPETGKKYYGTVSFDKKTGKLKLRGSLDKYGWIGRNQYWIR
jgi:uncharacterized protein (DUF2147 family)